MIVRISNVEIAHAVDGDAAGKWNMLAVGAVGAAGDSRVQPRW